MAQAADGGNAVKFAAAKPRYHLPLSRKAGKTVVGVLEPCYGSSHVIYGLEPRRYVHERLPVLPWQRLERRSTFLQFTPIVLDVDVALVHTWNAIPLNKDFIVSFELELPRYLFGASDAQIRFGLRRLTSNRCKAILALSDFAARSARRRFAEYGFPELAEKLSIFRGAIADPLAHGLPPQPSPDFAAEPFRAVVVGTQLFRKGGMYAIEAFERLRAAGLDVRLTLIGDFEDESYAFQDHLPDAAAWRARAAGHDWITMRGPIPNREVFHELRRHHMCLYPSLDESLGWLPIEAEMIEVPVLGNRVCAYPELIQHRETGWLVDLPTSATERWEGIDCEAAVRGPALERARALIVGGIIDCVRAVHERPALLTEWGATGRRRMMDLYGVEQASRRLEAIYDQALDG